MLVPFLRILFTSQKKIRTPRTIRRLEFHRKYRAPVIYYKAESHRVDCVRMYPSRYYRLPPFLGLVFVESVSSSRHHRPSAASLATLKNRYTRRADVKEKELVRFRWAPSLSRNCIRTKDGDSQTSTLLYDISMQNDFKNIEGWDEDGRVVVRTGGSPFMPSFSPPCFSLKRTYLHTDIPRRTSLPLLSVPSVTHTHALSCFCQTSQGVYISEDRGIFLG